MARPSSVGASEAGASMGSASASSASVAGTSSDRASLGGAFHKILGDARAYPHTLLYTVLCFLWLNIMIQGPGSLRSVPLAGIGFPPWIGPVLFCAATYLFFGVRQDLLLAISKPARHAATLGACGLIGLAGYFSALLAESPNPAVHVLLYAIGSAFVGFVASFMLIELAQVFGDHAPRQVLSLTIAAVLLSAPLVLGYLAAPLWLRIPLLVLVVVATAVLDRRLAGDHPYRNEEARSPEDGGAQTAPLRFMAMALPLGFSNGMLACGFMAMGPAGAACVDVAALLAVGVAMTVFAIMLELDFNQLIYQVGLPFAALGALVLGVFPAFVGTGLMFFQFAGFLFTYFVVWGLCAMLIRYLHQSAIWTVSYSTACLMFGQFLGGLVSCLVGALLPPWATSCVSLAVIASLFLVAVWNAGHKSFHEGWGTAKPALASVEISQGHQETVERMAVMAGLTARERDVFLILAQGRGRQFVQRELVISDNTAKVHIRNVYKKLGVHSMQELAEAVRRNSEQTVEEAE